MTSYDLWIIENVIFLVFENELGNSDYVYNLEYEYISSMHGLKHWYDIE